MDKKYKQLILVLSIFLALPLPAFSKDKQQDAKPLTADDIVAKMTFQLGLTDQQAALVKPIIENTMAQEEQIKLEEKKALSKVLTGDQLYAWNFLQNEAPREKKKHEK